MNVEPEIEGTFRPLKTPVFLQPVFFIPLCFVLVAGIVGFIWLRSGSQSPSHTDDHAESDHHEAEVMLSPEALQAAGITIETVDSQSTAGLIQVTGSVEPNQLQTQQVSSLVAGRLDEVLVTLGSRVKTGDVLARLSSPLIAEMHGKLHEAETRLLIARRTYERVQQADNRVGVLQARARLDEASINLDRTRKLADSGIVAGRDLTSAEAAYKTAKAEFDFQNNINLNREVQEAKAAVETAEVDVAHMRDSLKALGAPVIGEHGEHQENTAQVTIHSPLSGIVTERLVNAGVGVDPGKPMFTISNLASVWVMASVPVSQIGKLKPSDPATIRTPNLDDQPLTGVINYLDPLINETTRTAQVRIEVDNPKETLRVGMFVTIEFRVKPGGGASFQNEVIIPAQAVQHVGNQAIVFLPQADEPGAFEVREIEISDESNGLVRLQSGLKSGEKIVTQGSFTLKTQLLKGEMGEHDH